MAAIVWSDVLALPNAPAAFAAVGVPMQTVLLQLANTYLDAAIFDGEDGPATKLARIYYVAHLITIGLLASAIANGAASGRAGIVTKEEAGKIKREFGGFSSSNSGGATGSDPLGSTEYGRALLMLAWPKTRAVLL